MTKLKEDILANPKLARKILKEFDTANKEKGRIKIKNEVQYHKIKSASSQLFKNEVLTHY